MNEYCYVHRAYDACEPAASFNKAKQHVIKTVEGLAEGSEQVTFLFTDGSMLRLVHHGDCCERVVLEDFSDSDLFDLEGATFYSGEESSSQDEQPYARTEYGRDYGQSDSFTWTFYRLQTDRGTLVLRWLGSSNGYYSERVSVEFHESKETGK